jgi:hypothetical protein
MTKQTLVLVFKPAWFQYLLIPRKVITKILNHIKYVSILISNHLMEKKDQT